MCRSRPLLLSGIKHGHASRINWLQQRFGTSCACLLKADMQWCTNMCSRKWVHEIHYHSQTQWWANLQYRHGGDCQYLGSGVSDSWKEELRSFQDVGFSSDELSVKKNAHRVFLGLCLFFFLEKKTLKKHSLRGGSQSGRVPKQTLKKRQKNAKKTLKKRQKNVGDIDRRHLRGSREAWIWPGADIFVQHLAILGPNWA